MENINIITADLRPEKTEPTIDSDLAFSLPPNLNALLPIPTRIFISPQYLRMGRISHDERATTNRKGARPAGR
ncbi:MAG: hypothetical protein ACOC6G_02825 [Thermoproteota archaeon]